NIEGIRDVAQIKPATQIRRGCFRDVDRLAVGFGTTVEVQAVGSGCIRIKLDRGPHLKACRLETKGDSAAASKQVQDTRPGILLKARQLTEDDVVTHESDP